MTRTPQETGLAINADAVRRAVQAADRDAAQHVTHRTLRVNLQLKHRFVGRGGEFLSHDAIPQRRVAGVAIRCVIAVNGVGQGAALLKAAEDDEQLPHFVQPAAGDQSARTNQRVAAPVEKPWIAGDHRFEVTPPDNKLGSGAVELLLESSAQSPSSFVLRIFPGSRLLRRGEREFGAGDQLHRCIVVLKRQIKPARTPAIALAGLATAGLDGMRQVLAPFGCAVVGAAVGDHPHSAIRRRRKFEAAVSDQRSRMTGEVVVRGVVAFRFPMKIAILKIEPDGQAQAAVIRDH